LGTRVGGVLEDGAVTIWPCRDHTNVVGVLDSSNNPRSKDELLPGLSDVDNMNTYTEKKPVMRGYTEGQVPACSPSCRLFQT
jgi:hypothetical protein